MGTLGFPSHFKILSVSYKKKSQTQWNSDTGDEEKKNHTSYVKKIISPFQEMKERQGEETKE